MLEIFVLCFYIMIVIMYRDVNLNLYYVLHSNYRSGFKQPMYTETLPGGQLLALIIPTLTETMAGRYYCSASYASTEMLQASVNIETFGM